MNSSWLLGGGADGGWFNYAPNSGVIFSPGHGIDFYALGLQITGIASLMSAINLITTVLNMRPKGMTLFRMPVFTWMNLVVQFLLLFAVPVISVALFELTFDRLFDANFFNPDAGADPLLWQHLFWIFGHPEVYILILPSFGIISEVIPTFSRKPIFGYSFMVFSGIAIGFMGWGVWAHHMFVSGIGPISVAAFSLSTMFIAVPTGVKILNWLATIWGGRLRFTTAMLYAVGVISMFTIGGLSGVTHSIAPADTQQTDTYYIVAHFHYVIFGGALLGIFAGFYFWWPKVFGYFLNERLGKWGLLDPDRGLQCHVRSDAHTRVAGHESTDRHVRQGLRFRPVEHGCVDRSVHHRHRYRYLPLQRWLQPGPVEEGRATQSRARSVGRSKPRMDDGIADARAQLRRRHRGRRTRRVLARKYGYDEDNNVVRIAATEDVTQDGSATDVHLPSPSYYPIVLALGLPIIAYGLIYSLWLCIPGAALLVYGMVGWIFENPDDPNAAHGHHDDDHHDDGDDEPDALESGDDTAGEIEAGSEADTNVEETADV